MKLIVIGCGAVFKHFYVEALQALERRGVLSVGALVDGVVANRDAAVRAFPRARGFATLAEALGQGGAQAVVVLTPPAGHHRILLEAAKAGLHGYCEKPLTTSVRETEEVQAAFSQARLRCKVAYTRRFFPNIRALRAQFQQLPAGSRHFAICDGETFRWPIATGGIFNRADPGAGVVWDKVSHNLDLVNWFSPIRELTSVRSSCRPGAVPTDVFVEGRTDTGTFDLAVSWTAGLPNTVMVRGDGRRFTCANGLVPWVHAEPATGLPPLDVPGEAPGGYGDAVRLAVQEFAAPGADSLLADCADDVALTGYLSQINRLARQLS